MNMEHRTAQNLPGSRVVPVLTSASGGLRRSIPLGRSGSNDAKGRGSGGLSLPKRDVPPPPLGRCLCHLVEGR